MQIKTMKSQQPTGDEDAPSRRCFPLVVYIADSRMGAKQLGL